MKEIDSWNLVIHPKRKLFDLQLKDVIKYRDLIFLFVKRDFVTLYKQTILGPLWFIINPLIATIMYLFVFGKLANLGTDGIPFILFYYTGTLLWTFVKGCLMDASNVFVTNANIFGKVYFPRFTVAISNIFNNLIRAGVQFVMLIGFFIYYLYVTDDLQPSWFICAFPLIFLWLAIIGTGMGMVISALTTKYRDLRIVLPFVVDLAMYAAPVVYPMSQIPAKYAWINYVNPISAPIELFRIWFYGAGYIPPMMMLSSVCITITIFFIGLLLFNQNERNFVDVV